MAIKICSISKAPNGWTEDAGLHQRYKDWREEVELLMDTVLSHIKNADTKMNL